MKKYSIKKDLFWAKRIIIYRLFGTLEPIIPLEWKLIVVGVLLGREKELKYQK